MLKKHLSTTILTKALTFACALVQGVFLTRLLGPDGKGLLTYFQANIGLLTLLLGLALPSGVTYFSANGKIAAKKILGLGYASLTTALGLLALLYYLETQIFHSHLLIPVAAAGSFYVFYFLSSFTAFFLTGIYAQVLAGKTKFGFINSLELGTAIIRIFVFSYLFFSKASQAEQTTLFVLDLGFSVFTLLVYAVSSALFFDVGLSLRLSFKDDILPMLKYVLPLYFAGISAFLYNRSDLYLIEHYRGLSELGIYSIAAGGGQLLLFFPTSINSVLYAYLVKAEGPERLRLFAQISRLNTCLVGVFAVALLAASGWLVPTLYGEKFASALWPFRVLVLANFFVSIKFLFVLFNQITANLRENIKSELLVGLLSIGINLFVVPRYGSLGAAATLLICHFLALIYLLKKIQRRNPLFRDNWVVPSLKEIKDYRRFLRPAAYRT